MIRNISKRAVVATALAVAMVLGSIGLASASEPEPRQSGPSGAAQPAAPGQSTAECSANGASGAGDKQKASVDMTQIDGTRAEQLTADVTALIDSGEVAVHVPEKVLVRDGAKVYRVEAGPEKQQFTSVSIPISGSYSEPVSNLTVLFDADGAVVQHSETLINKGDSGNFHITSYVDGQLKNSQDTDIKYMSDKQLRDEVAAGPTDEGAQSKNTAACLASVLGVSVAVGGIIAFACSGSCSVPITPVTAPICAACIGGFAVIGGASITAIANCF